MSSRLKRGPREESREPAPETIDLIRLYTRQMERARQLRDAAISQARGEKQWTLRQIGDAAGLSVSRVKQIDGFPDPRAKRKSPVTEVDLLKPLASADADTSDERILLLNDVDPFLPQWPSEKAFIEADEQRHPFTDLFWEVYDGDARETWRLRYCSGTKELYAWTPRDPDPAYAEDSTWGGAAKSGPCIVLGHVFSWDLLERCLDAPMRHVAQRPGGLAWVYGRVQLLNRMLDALSRDYSIPTSDAIVTYLTETLTDSERIGR